MTDRTTLTLYRHDDEKSGGVLLSLDGWHTAWIPKQFVIEPATTILVKVRGQSLKKGQFEIETWKAEEAGFITGDDERQEELAL